jgi:hypothetical protein
MVRLHHFTPVMNHRWLAVVLTLLAIWMALPAAAEVEATLDRDSVAAGNGALLTLTISGGRAEPPEIPTVENLIIQSRGQSQQIRMINGVTSVSITYSFVVGSNVAGDYEIPAIEVKVAGNVESSQPLKLKVLAAEAVQPPPGMPQNPPGTPAEETEEENRFGFLTVELAAKERSHVYVGEIAPVRIRAWLPANSRAQLRSGVKPEGQGFTVHHVSDQPQQTQEIKDGKRYTVVTWYGGISATKAGQLPASLSLDATVAVRDTSAPKPPRQRSGPFADPFFDDAFDNLNARLIQKDVTLKSEDQEIEVRALPAAGRPQGFNGAVGKFKFDQATIPATWTTGEPQQIGVTLGGSGNFALADTPALTPADAWKTYPGKGDFSPGDQASFSGTKTFRFSAVPRKGGDHSVALTFSYFDPDAGTYETLTTTPQLITVAGQDLAEDPVVEAAPSPPPVKKDAGLIGQHTAPRPEATLVPLVSRPAFVPLLALSGGLGAVGALLLGWRIHRDNPRRQALAAMEKATRDALQSAANARDVPGFFAAARLALQQRLGAQWNQPPHAITTADIESRIASDSPVARFFREADRHEYHHQPAAEIQPQWRTLLNEALASLTPSTR